MRVVLYFISLLIGHWLGAMNDQRIFGNDHQNRLDKKIVRGQSIIPVDQEDVSESPLLLAAGGPKGGSHGGAHSGFNEAKKEHKEEHKDNAKENSLAASAHNAKPAGFSAPQQPIPASSQAVTHGQHASMPASSAPTTAPVKIAPTAQPAPSKPVTQTPVVVPAHEEEIKGIDTVDIDEPQGNWLLKRIWWQRGQAQYEKIKTLVEAIMETRMAFFAKRTEWDKKIFDPFYLEIGLGRGVLEELISNLMKRIEDERAKAGELNPEERSFLDSLEAEKSTLDQLQRDIQLINEIDGRIDDMITLLIQQINKARSYENQAWQNLKDIAQELSDKKARELFYTMSTSWQNINDISSFIQGQFFESFDQLGKQAQDQIAKVKATVQTLKEKGIDLKKQWQEIEDKSKVDQDKERLEQEKIAEELAIQKKKEEEAKRGFFAKLLDQAVKTVNSIYGYIKSGMSALWNGTVGRFFTKSVKPSQVNADHEQEQKQIAQASSDQHSAVSPHNDHEQTSEPAQSEPATAQLPTPPILQQPVELK